MCEVEVLYYVQFYFVGLGLDLHNDLGYLSNDGDTQELFKCLDPIDPKIVIYVEHATPIQKKKKKLLIPISMLLMLLIWLVMVLCGGCGCGC